MQVLVTGGSGFIGSDLKSAVYLDDPFPLYPTKDELDIEDMYSVDSYFEQSRPNVVIHLAGQTNVGYSAKHPFEDLSANVRGMINLIRASEEYDVSKFIYTSTCVVYGNCMYMREDEQPFPESPYGISKYTAEQYLRISTIPTKTVLRLSNVVGCSEGRIVDTFAKCLETSEEPVFFGSGKDSYRDYIHVHDIRNAIKMMMFKDFPGTFNVCTGVPTNLDTLWALMQGVWRIDGEEPIRQELRDCDATWAVPSAEKLQNVCGFDYRYNLQGALKQIYGEMQKNS